MCDVITGPQRPIGANDGSEPDGTGSHRKLCSVARDVCLFEYFGLYTFSVLSLHVCEYMTSRLCYLCRAYLFLYNYVHNTVK